MLTRPTSPDIDDQVVIFNPEMVKPVALQPGSGRAHLRSRKEGSGSLSHPGMVLPSTSLSAISGDVVGHAAIYVSSGATS